MGDFCLGRGNVGEVQALGGGAALGETLVDTSDNQATVCAVAL